ncbi:YhgE/Pip family protein [Sporosarcina sp. CAU 1771]
MKKTMTWAEWKGIFKSRKIMIPMIAILFIPVLYAGMFLWAFWNPYALMSELPVAIVNLDEGAEMDGEELALGKELTDKLVDGNQFQFVQTSLSEAEEGLKNQDYYVVIEIPENFSAHATTLLDDNPEKLLILYKPNEGFNFLSGQIAETAMDRIRAEVNENVASTYAEKLFDSIHELGDGFGEAADGAGELHDGASELASGSEELKGYLITLAESTITLADGSDKLLAGASEAAKGANDLHTGMGALSTGSTELLSGASEASKGATALNEGVSTYTEAVNQLTTSYSKIAEKEQELGVALSTLDKKTSEISLAIAELSKGSSNLSGGIEQLAAGLAPIIQSLPEEQQAVLQATLDQVAQGSADLTNGMQQVAKRTTALHSGTSELSSGANQLAQAHSQALNGLETLNNSSAQLVEGAKSLATGNAALATGAQQLAEGIDKAQSGSSILATGLTTLTEGTGTLKSGTDTLASKSQELATGSTTLADGMAELDKGALTLKEKLVEANETASEIQPTEKTYAMAAAPVDVEKESINEVPNYGTGFAPYFLSLGLFVGALLLSIVFPLVEPAIKPTGALRWFASKVSVLAIVGLLQALIAVGIVKFALGMETVNTPLFVLTAILTSYTFIALVQMLVSIFSDVGRFIAILILILQLTTSAGTFPLELIPAPLQIFNVFLPMTYSVHAFKASISTGDFSFLWANNGILTGFTVVCLAITFGYFKLIYTKRHSNQTVSA